MKKEQDRNSNFDETDRNCQPVGGRHLQGCFRQKKYQLYDIAKVGITPYDFTLLLHHLH